MGVPEIHLGQYRDGDLLPYKMTVLGTFGYIEIEFTRKESESID